MSEPDTADLARRVMEAAEKACPGPWQHNDPATFMQVDGKFSDRAVYVAGNAFPWRMAEVQAPDDDLAVGTCEFIALSRTAAPALAQAVLEKDRALAEIDRLIEFYFSPWGAAKAATWEEIDGDGPAFSAEAMLDHIRRLRARTALKDKTNG